MHRFIVPGRSQPKQRPRLANGKAYTPVETRDYEALVRRSARAAKVPKLEGDVYVAVVFYMPTRRQCDVDNLLKSIMDGLNGVAYDDDTQVTHIQAWKRYSKENPHAAVLVGRATDG